MSNYDLFVPRIFSMEIAERAKPTRFIPITHHDRAHFDLKFRCHYVRKHFSHRSLRDYAYIVWLGATQLEKGSWLLNDCSLAEATISYGPEMQIWID